MRASFRTARSITGELVWDAAAGFVTVDTPRTQAVIGFLSTTPHTLKTVTLRSPTRFGAVYVTAMEERAPVETSRRLLVTAIGQAKNTDMEYETTSQPSPLGTPYQRLRAVGQPPILLEAVTGQVEIRSHVAGQLKAWALDVIGNRVRPVPLTVTADVVTLTMQPEYKTVYYEISAE